MNKFKKRGELVPSVCQILEECDPMFFIIFFAGDPKMATSPGAALDQPHISNSKHLKVPFPAVDIRTCS